MQKWIIIMFVSLSVVLFSGCREPHASSLADPTFSVPAFVPRAHLPGTLLRGHDARLWMGTAWPERAAIPPAEIARMHLDPTDAIPMSSVEELCLRDRGALWHGREGWELMRFSDSEGEYWYVDRARHLRRQAEAPIMRSWHDDPAVAVPWTGSREEWETRYRDLGPMPPADGALIRVEDRVFVYVEGEMRPFASQELARAVGYTLSRAIEIPVDRLWAYGEVSGPLTAEVFLTCPMAAANARRDDDADGDGAIRGIDCDDHDANRAPHLVEICDAIDNNCDGVVDEGFPVGFPCTLDDGCRSPGVTACTFDRWNVTCRNDDALCE